MVQLQGRKAIFKLFFFFFSEKKKIERKNTIPNFRNLIQITKIPKNNKLGLNDEVMSSILSPQLQQQHEYQLINYLIQLHVLQSII